MNGPQQQRMHSPNEQSNVKANIGAKSVTNERVTEEDLVEERRPTQEEVWGKLVDRANEERIFINGHPVTALFDTGNHVMHVSHEFCLGNGIQIHLITQLVNIEGTGGMPLTM